MKTSSANFKRDLKALTPITINKMELRNRIVMPGMGSLFGEQDNTAGPRIINYYAERAKGGTGLVIVEYTAVSAGGRAAAMELGLWNDRFIPGLTKLADAIHQYGAKAGIQLHHAGRGTKTDLTGLRVVGASPIAGTKDVPEELTKEEIADLVKDYADAAVRAKKAGFDCVEIHGAHGYLLSQFMSPFSNKRTDEYGGSLENRMRFPLEVVKAVREAVGPDYCVVFRISAEDSVEGGRTIADCVEESKMLEKAGVDLLNVSVAMLDSAFNIITGGYQAAGWLSDWSKQVKDAVSIPVCVVGKNHVPEVVEAIVAEGKADLVAIGRAALVDPEFANKMADGRWENIRQCIHCLNGCYAEPVTCTQNPNAGHECEHALVACDLAKEVVVVGAGPAGLEAAQILAKRCHHVTVLEKEDVVGGQVRLAAMPPHKEDFQNVIDYRVKEAVASGVNIQTGVTATADMLRRMRADVVVVATGATPVIPPIPGVDKPVVVTAVEALSGKKPVGQNIVIVGGGAVGAETAHYYAANGKNVTVVEMLPGIANDVPFGNKKFLIQSLEEKATILVSTAVKEIRDNSVLVEVNGEMKELAADTVIMAVGSKPNDKLAEEVAEVLPDAEIYVIGDAFKVRKILHAVAEGNQVGREI